MIALCCWSLVWCAQLVGHAACDGIHTLNASTDQRRAALDACATAVSKTPIEFLLSATAQLNRCDRRSSDLGDIAAAWNPHDLAREPTLSTLLELATGKGGSTPGAQIVATRALLALPPDLRPAAARAITPIVVELTAVPSKMAYDKKEFSVAPGQVVQINFHNPDALEHNLLFVTPGALAEMGVAGDRMGQGADGRQKEFIPDSPKVLAVMGLVSPGSSQSFWFIAPTTPGTYPFVCTYPSHWRTMNGKMKVVAPPTSAPPAPKEPPSPQPTAAN